MFRKFALTNRHNSQSKHENIVFSFILLIEPFIVSGMTERMWELEQIQKSLWWLFHDTYQRRKVYTDITKSKILQENRSGYKVVTLDICETKNQVLAKKNSIGNGARHALDGLNVSNLRKFDFKHDCL